MEAPNPQENPGLYDNTIFYYEAPPPRDYYAETADTLAAQVAMAPELWKAEAMYRPRYEWLDYKLYDYFYPQYETTRAETALATAPIWADSANYLRTAERTGDMQDLAVLGPQYVASVQATMPQQAAMMDELMAQASAELAQGGYLSPDEVRAIEQDTRSAYSARGMELSNPAMFAEVMNLEGARNQREAEARAFAGDVLGWSKSFYGDPLQAVVGRPSSNLGWATGSGAVPAQHQTGAMLFNPESAYASSLYGQNYSGAMNAANQQAAMDQDYFNTIYNAQASYDLAEINADAMTQAAEYGMYGDIVGGAFQGLGNLFSFP